jgi:polysaccharide deacetylase 2 family uncharacterized protein YibQ
MKRKRRDFILAAFLVTVFAVAAYMVLMPETPKRAARRHHTAAIKAEAPRPRPPVPEAHPVIRAKVAIIIDDLGSDMEALSEITGLGLPVCVAVLPMLPHSKDTAVAAHKAGLEVLLHLPMQPDGESMRGLGPGALMEHMDRSEMVKTVSEDLSSVPGAVGVNNHMGSGLTADAKAMRELMVLLKGRGLFFVDSRTTPATVALDMAKEEGIKAVPRKVFLDDLDDTAEVKKQIDRLVEIAVRDGYAVAIGHPRKATIEALKEELPGMRERGVAVVRVSELVR